MFERICGNGKTIVAFFMTPHVQLLMSSLLKVCERVGVRVHAKAGERGGARSR